MFFAGLDHLTTARRRPRILAQIVSAVYALLLVQVALAQDAPTAGGIHYTVQVDAPGTLDELLNNNLDLVRWRGNPRVDLPLLQRLVREAPAQARTLVETEGYYTPKIEAKLDTSGAEPVARISVDPGPPVTVGQVEIELRGFGTTGSGLPFDDKALRSDWTLPAGRQFRQADWESAKRDFLRQVTRKRFARAQLAESRATVDPAAHKAQLRIVVDSGPDVHFGALHVVGLYRYPQTVVTNLNRISPGDPYSEAALQAFQTRLQDTGYFSSVQVSLDTTGQEEAAATPDNVPLVLPVLVQVTENKQRSVEAGAGLSTNTGARMQLNYNDLNVHGTRLKSRLVVEQKRQTGRADFYWPTTPDGFDDSVGGGVERTDVQGEITNVTSISGRRAWGSPRLEQSVTLEALTELRTIDSLPSTRSKSLPLTYAVTKRELDNLITPTSGYVLAGQFGGALLPVMTDRQFVRAWGRAFLLKPLSTKVSLVMRAEAGAVGSRAKTGVPSTFLFRAGGDQSVRGYAYQELGVKEDGATVGARYLATASAELQYWFKPPWGMAVFYDAGNAADRIADLRPKSGYGVGARWRSPAGPINVDIAYGQAARQVRLHFSLGFTF